MFLKHMSSCPLCLSVAKIFNRGYNLKIVEIETSYLEDAYSTNETLSNETKVNDLVTFILKI